MLDWQDGIYDANGNMLQAGDNVLKWVSSNQPHEVPNANTNSVEPWRSLARYQHMLCRKV
jgi:hypothetical protein